MPFMFASRIALVLATASLAVAPVAAQANTRAGDHGAVYSRESLSQPGLAREFKGMGIANDDDDDDDDDLGLILLGIFGVIGVAAAVFLIDDEEDQSRGT